MFQRNIILREKNGAYLRYYAKPFDEEDKLLFSALRQKRMREIVFLVLLNQKATVKLLSDNLNLPRSTLSFYLKYLVEHNILNRERIGYENFYTVIDEDRIAKILIAYRSSFMDKLVDRALNTWLETRFHRDQV
jgi:predicted transcriptional regulator